MKKLYYSLVIFTISSCAFIDNASYPTHIEVDKYFSAYNLNSASSFLVEQSVELHNNESNSQWIQLLEIFDNRMVIVGIGALGNELFSIELDNKNVIIKGLLHDISAIELVNHLQLIYWPISELSELEEKGYKIIETQKVREVFYQLKPYLVINYENDNKWRHPITLTNIVKKFKLTITPLQQEGEK